MRAYLEDDAVKAKRSCDISGVLELSKSGYGFIRAVNIEYTQSSGAFVSETLIQQHNLKAGDFITGKAKLLEEDKPYILFEVSSVNDKENHSYISFEDQNVVCALTQLNINDEISNLLVGASNIIAQNKENKKLPKEYIEQIQNKYTLVYVGLELNKEQELLLKDVAGEVYYTSMVAPCLEHINLVKFALARAKRLSTFGKDVVLFIDSIDKVVKNQNLTLDNNLFDIKINTLDIVKELAISSRQFSVEGSLTVLGLYNYQQDNIFDANIIGELSNYYSKIYKSN
jgi:transcription termination factor Rho